MGIVNGKGELIATENDASRASPFPDCPRGQDFENIVLTSVHDKEIEFDSNAGALIEFRIWKQGRVNLESLIQKLRSAVRHAIWDLVTEYNFLPTVLTIPLKDSSDGCKPTLLQFSKNKYSLNSRNNVFQNSENGCIKNFENYSVQTSGIETVQSHANKTFQNVYDEAIQNPGNVENTEDFDQFYESREKVQLHKVYHTTLPYWFQFALEMNVPAMKKHIVTLQRRHSLAVTLKELQNLIHSNTSDTSTRTFVQRSRQPFVDDDMEEDPLAHKISECTDNVNKIWLKKTQEQENNDKSVYLPCDFFADEQGIYVKSILVARNFQQWKASFVRKIESEQLMPKGNIIKHSLLASNFVTPYSNLSKILSVYF